MTGSVLLVDALQRQAVDQVAFYPRSRLQRAVEDGEIEFAFENGEACGYLWHGPVNPGRDLVIYQAVIHYDLRRRLKGAELVARLIEMAVSGGATAVRARCRSDIEANEFWRTLGFDCIAVGRSGVRRNTDVNTWRRPVLAGLWDHITVTPSTKAKDREPYDLLYRTDRATLPQKSRFAR